mmetsp:Transcript_17518/g.50123  ORF Transcript_17518/g.50123 Transcript_17518/m.50123 type:complete len:226 (-) Transcript_17518:662-1339(-)
MLDDVNNGVVAGRFPLRGRAAPSLGAGGVDGRGGDRPKPVDRGRAVLDGHLGIGLEEGGDELAHQLALELLPGTDLGSIALLGHIELQPDEGAEQNLGAAQQDTDEQITHSLVERRLVGKEQESLQDRRAGPTTWVGTLHSGTGRGDDTGIGRLVVRELEGVNLAGDEEEPLEEGQLSRLILPFPNERGQGQDLAVRGHLIQLQEGLEMVGRADVEVLKVELLRD